MLSGLDFTVARPSAPAAPNRADVACFVGFVARRRGVPLPADVRTQLRDAGWLEGPWDVNEERIDALDQVPVAFDTWEAFARLFAWEERPVGREGASRCATYLGAAVRSFFAHGGRRAVVVRVGDPWPYLGGEDRAAARDDRLDVLTPSLLAARPFDGTDPSTWRGIEHLYGLSEVSHVCFPDLADIFSAEPPELPAENPPAPAPEVFVPCSAEEPAEEKDSGLRFILAPRLTGEGFGDWAEAVGAVRTFLADHRRDALCVTSLPLAHDSAEGTGTGRTLAQADWLGFLTECGVLGGAAVEESPASAFVQLVWPWVRTMQSEDLPELLEPAEGLFAGILAENALARGTFRSVAGTRLPWVVAPEPMPDIGVGEDSPAVRLARRVCLIGPEPDGITLLSDVTGTSDEAWRQGGVSRLMSTLLRAARRVGEAQIFEANGPELWTRIRRAMEDLLDGFLRVGALRGPDAREAYRVRCGRDTMTQSDLDNGRVRVEITVLPAGAIEHITVSLDLTTDAPAVTLGEVA